MKTVNRFFVRAVEKSTFTPAQGRMLVKRLPADVTADVISGSRQTLLGGVEVQCGEIVKLGPPLEGRDTLFAEGDIVVYQGGQAASDIGALIEINYQGETLLVLQEQDILGVVE